MDIFCLPSLYEGMGLVSLEGLVSGLGEILNRNIPKHVKSDKIIFQSLHKRNWANNLDARIFNPEMRKKLDALKLKDYDIKNMYNEIEVFYEGNYK